MRYAPANQTSEPVADINITPLIDVMLVLLVMMIITIPLASHKVPVSLPQPGPVVTEAEPHRLSIAADGALNWDGRTVTDAGLSDMIARTRAAEQDPMLIIETHPDTRYDRFHTVMTMVGKGGIDRLAFAGNHRLP